MTTREKELLRENEELKIRLEEAEEALNAIRNGEVDAIVVKGNNGDQVFSLTSAETPYRIIIEEMQEGAVTITSFGLILYCNPRFGAILGQPAEKIVGNPLAWFINPEDADKLSALIETGLHERSRDEIRIISSSKREEICLFTVNRLPSGMTGDLCIIVSNITEFKLYQNHLAELVEEQTAQLEEANSRLKEDLEILSATEKKLLASEHILSYFMGTVPVGVIRWGITGIIRDANDRFLEMFGYSREELAENELNWIALSAEYTQRDKDASAEYLATGKCFPYEKANLRKDGTIIHVIISAVMVDPETKDGIAFILDISESKKVEEELKHSRETLEEAQRLSKIGSWEVDIQTRHMRWSDNMYPVLDVDPGSFDPGLDNFFTLIHPDDRERMKETIGNALRLQQPYTSEYRIIRKNGEIRYIQPNARFIQDNNGIPVVMVGTSQDITERKKLELALAEGEERFRSIAETVPAMISISSLDDATILFTNTAYNNAFGYSKEEISKQKAPDLYFDSSERDQLISIIRNQGHVDNYTVRVKKRDGTPMWLLTSIGPIIYNGVPALIGGSIDITDRKIMEEALREREERLKFHLENSPLAVIEWDAGYFVTQWSVEAERMFGYKKEETLGKKIDTLNLIFPEDIPVVVRSIERLSGGEELTVVSSNRNVRKSGDIIDCTWYNSVLLNDKGKMASVMSLVEDNTQRLEAEKALKESKKKLSDIYNSMSEGLALHELVYDSSGKPFDYVILETNPAFETITGLNRNEAQGRNATDVFSVPEAPYLDIYQKVALTGEPAYFESFFPPMNKHFSVSVFTPAPGKFATIFQDISERKHAEEQIRNSELHFRLLFETMRQGAVYQDANGTIISMNPAAEQILGKTHEEFLGSSSVEVEHDTIREDGSVFPGMEHPAMIALETGKTVLNVMMGVFNPRLNEYRWINIDAIPLFRIDEDKPYQVYTLFHDVTERRLAELAIRESERKLRAIMEATRESIWMFSPEGVILHANLMAASRLSLPEAELIGKKMNEILTPELANSRMTHLKEVVRSGIPLEFEDQRAGFAFLHSFNPVIGEDGNVSAVVSYSRDITERKKAEETLRMILERFYFVLSSMNHSLLLISADNQVEFANTAFCRLFNLKEQPDELINLPAARILELIKPSYSEPDAAINRIQEIVSKGQDVSGENIRMHDNKTLLRDFVPLTVMGKHSGRLWIHTDITDLKKAEQALRDSEERFRLALKNAPVTVALQDLNLVFQWAYNQKTHKQVDIIGKTDTDLFSPEDVEWIVPLKKELLETGREVNVEKWLTSNGIRLFLGIHFEPVRDASGAITGIGIATVDLTKRKIAEEELNKVNEELQLFNEAMVGRELRMIELKKEINELSIKAGLPPQYETESEEALS